MNVQEGYQLVVIYQDSNYMWKVGAIDPRDTTDRMLRPTEYELTCIASAIGTGIPVGAQIAHLGVTTGNRTAYLEWPPLAHIPANLDESDQQSVLGGVSQDRILRLLLRSTSGEKPLAVSWREVEN